MNVLKLLRLSRLTRLPKNSLLAYFHKPSKIVYYVAIRYSNNSLYVDVAFTPNGRFNTTVRYKVLNRPFIDLYRKARCQNALKNLVLKYATL